MKKIIFGLLLFTFCITAYGQQKKIDSLKKLIAVAKDDTSRVLLMRDLSLLFFYSKPDSALATAHKMLQISKSAQYAKGEIMALNEQGIVYRNSGNYPKALGYYLSAQKLAEQVGDKTMEFTILANVGTIYLLNGDSRRGINFFFESLQIAKRLNAKPQIAALANNIGDAYEHLNMLDSALFFIRRALSFPKGSADPDAIATNYNNLGNIYFKMKRPDTAICLCLSPGRNIRNN